jgi:2-(1,2-epoxy-1,2-dihydrophenyl)acetyl-CoA isomerase
MSDPTVHTHTTGGGVCVLTLDHQATRNALGEAMMASLVTKVERFAGDPQLRVLVLTGAGSAFSSGADVRRFAARIEAREQPRDAEPDEPVASSWERLDPSYTVRERGVADTGPEIIKLLHNLEKPSIAAVNGPAYGVGCGIALACDFRVAAQSARFSEAFIRNGLVPSDGSTWLLPKLIGTARTLWMQYTGEPIDGPESYRIGLANAVVADDELMDHVLAMATRLAKGPVFAMGLIKQLVRQGFQQDLAEHLVLAVRARELARTSFDHEEGVRAFLEKREPRFLGR